LPLSIHCFANETPACSASSSPTLIVTFPYQFVPFLLADRFG